MRDELFVDPRTQRFGDGSAARANIKQIVGGCAPFALLAITFAFMEPSWYIAIAWFVISSWGLLSAHGLYEIWKTESWFRAPTQDELIQLGIDPARYTGKITRIDRHTAHHSANLSSGPSAEDAKFELQKRGEIVRGDSPDVLSSEISQDEIDDMNRSATTEASESTSQPSWAKIAAWGLAICLITGLAQPLTSSSNTPTILGWIAPQTRQIMLEAPIEELVGYFGIGLGGAIGPALLLCGIYWGIRRLFKPGFKFNWGGVLALSIVFGAMSVMGSYQSNSRDVSNFSSDSDLHLSSGIEDSLSALAAEMADQVPIQVDHMTTLTGVAAVGSTLNLYHSIDVYLESAELEATKVDLLVQTRERLCQKPEMVSVIEQGVSVYYRYSGLGGNLIDFTVSECG